VADDPDEREYDALISTGEQITVTLLAMMLNKLGYKSQIITGFSGKDSHGSGLQKGANSQYQCKSDQE